MTFREQCALAAMREELRDSLADGIGLSGDYHADIAAESWLFADAMEAERAKRETPGEPQLTAAQVMELGRRVGKEELVAACETARREGRDEGLREGKGQCEHGLSVYSALSKDFDALAAETAKLRAVAEAAARLQRLRDSNRPDGIGEASLQLDGALGNWLPGWRTK